MCSFTRLTTVMPLVAGLLFTYPACAEWSDDPTLRTPVVTAEYRQYHPRLIQVHNGFFVTWQDARRENTHVDVYAQKININGDLLWPVNGRVIAAGPENSLVYQFQFNAGLVDAGEGGALIAWNDSSNVGYSQAFATKATTDPTVAWGDPGESIQGADTAVPMLANPTRGANILPEKWGMVADSERGLFVPLGTGFGRIDSSGRLRTNWFYDSSDSRVAGLAVPMVPVLEADDKDAVIVFWNHGNTYFSGGIRARKLVDPESSWPSAADTFSVPWGTLSMYEPENSISLCNVAAVPDNAGGAIAVWIDGRVVTDTSHFRVYAQQVNSEGNLMWPEGGIEVSGDVMTSSCYWWSKMFAVDDGEGGVVIAWNDSQESVRAQRLKADGSIQWPSGGVVLATDNDSYAHLTSHGLLRATDGNFIMLYHRGLEEILVAQKLNAAMGSPMWGEGQVVFEGCFSPYNAGNAPMVTDGRAGAVIAWEACDGNIYAHRVIETSKEWDVIFKNGFE